MADPASNGERTSLVSNILAIVGFIILIVVVIWGLMNLASISRGWFSSLFGGSNSSIEVTAPATTTSGTPFTISWDFEPEDAGTYAFLYQCRNGFQFQTSGAGGALNGVPCGAAFTVPSENNSLSVIPRLGGTDAMSIPLSIIFIPSATGTQVQGSATVTVLPEGGTPGPEPEPTPEPTPEPQPTPEPRPTTTPPRPTPQPTPRPSGPADISARIVSVQSDVSGATVTFDIANTGLSASGSYYFSATLPTYSPYTYQSPLQASLAPGAHVLSTLRFGPILSGTFSVYADSTNAVREANESNNLASQYITAQYNQYPYQYHYPTYQQPYTQYYPYAY